MLSCALALLVGCGDIDEPPLRVFAASSMTDVLGEYGNLFESSSIRDVEFNFAGSSALREQLLDGADADVFLSANQAVMQDVVNAGLTDGEPVWVAENTLTVAVPLGNPAEISSLSDFADDSLLLGLCAPGVPCGDLAAQVLEAQGVVASVDTLEPNVRSLLAKVELGELDAALVYRTDVVSSDEVEEIVLPEGVGGTAIYLAVALSTEDRDGSSFISLMTAPTSAQLLIDAGFDVP